MIPRLRERLTLVLLALLPFHALGVTVLTRAVAGPGHAPFGVLAFWKEALLGVILLLAAVEITRSDWKAKLRLDRIDRCVVVLAAALAFGSLWVGVPLKQALYGIRYDLVPLAAFLVLRRVEWSKAFLDRLPLVLAAAVLAAVLYALLTLLLPDAFFTALGYSDLHSLYVPDRAIAAFQHVGGTMLRRLQGPMSGPNQFGIWLACLLPVIAALRSQVRRVIAPLALLAIVLTFSRAAWIAAAVIVVIVHWPQLKKLSVTAVTILCIGTLTISLFVLWLFPSVIVRIESSADHVSRPMEAVAIMALAPFGRGLGSAGPAQNRVADACVYLEEGSDASWASVHRDLCVFVGDKQVQPSMGGCDCPFLPENWYLQLGVEGGWVAFFAFIALVVLVVRRLWPTPPALSLLAVSIAALFLHAWEDAAVAYAVWILCAITVTFWTASSRRPARG